MSFPTYSSYKDSGVECLGEVPAHWRLERLKRICSVTPSNVDKKTYEGQNAARLCNYTDVYYNDEITSDMDFMEATASEDEIRKFTLRAGDTIVTKDSESADDIGIPAYVPHDLPGVVCGYHLTILRPNPGVNGKFIKRLFESPFLKARFAVSANGLTRVGLSQYAIDNTVVPVAPIDEQNTIAAFLDHETARIDALVEEQKRLIELLKEKRQAVISHAVTKGLDPNVPMKDSGVEWLGEVPAHWTVVPLGRFIQLQRGLDITKDQQNPGPYPVVSSGGVDSHHDEFFCKGPGVVVGRKGTVGKVHYVDDDFWPHDTTLYVREWNGNFPRYVYYKLISMALEKFDTGSANPTLNRNVVHPEKVSWPPLNEQSEIAAHLDSVVWSIEQLTDSAGSFMDLLLERRSALISAAVTGKIDVRGWQPPKAASSAFMTTEAKESA